jgi:hypothetical protein
MAGAVLHTLSTVSTRTILHPEPRSPNGKGRMVRLWDADPSVSQEKNDGVCKLSSHPPRSGDRLCSVQVR